MKSLSVLLYQALLAMSNLHKRYCILHFGTSLIHYGLMDSVSIYKNHIMNSLVLFSYQIQIITYRENSVYSKKIDQNSFTTLKLVSNSLRLKESKSLIPGNSNSIRYITRSPSQQASNLLEPISESYLILRPPKNRRTHPKAL